MFDSAGLTEAPFWVCGIRLIPGHLRVSRDAGFGARMLHWKPPRAGCLIREHFARRRECCTGARKRKLEADCRPLPIGGWPGWPLLCCASRVSAKRKSRSWRLPWKGKTFLSPYFQNTKSGGIYCQVFAGILAWKWFCINICYFRQGARGLTGFPQKDEEARVPGESRYESHAARCGASTCARACGSKEGAARWLISARLKPCSDTKAKSDSFTQRADIPGPLRFTTIPRYLCDSSPCDNSQGERAGMSIEEWLVEKGAVRDEAADKDGAPGISAPSTPQSGRSLMIPIH
jgi:hypothetical protein